MDRLLKVEGLSVRYGAILAVDHVSLEVGKGEIVSVIGANGAGKSTIINAISGLVETSHGSILFRGENIARLPAHEIVQRGIVQVPEGRRIFGSLTVQENLDVAATTGRSSRKDFDHVFELFPRLKERLGQKAGTLSGGEQQMLALARALVTKGEVFLLDEPSMGLAPALVETIFEIIKRINSEGTTILLVEQNAYKAMSIASRAYVLEMGRVTLSGSSQNLRDDPKVKAAYLGG